MPTDLRPYPLKHYWETMIELSADNAASSTTMIPLLVCDKSMANAHDLNTNPYHNDYTGIKASPMTYLESEVDKIRIGANVVMPVVGQETGIEAIGWRMMLVAMSFDDAEIDDEVGGEVLDTLVGVKEHSSGNYLEPNWSGTDLASGIDLYTNANTDFSLTTNSVTESITWDDDNFINAVRESSISGKLKSCTPSGLVEDILYKDRPYWMKPTWFDVPSKCIRQNQNTFLGLLIDVPNGHLDQQLYKSTELTNVSHFRMNISIYFNEKNNQFRRN